ncbi:MAG: hypothetical protein EAZ92_16675 [Candidatus Kapaibacterium sp.]|nr:MAG: hypothetical protein EAZ92_16675 [Candidatus Kapabacteria bacterium]
MQYRVGLRYLIASICIGIGAFMTLGCLVSVFETPDGKPKISPADIFMLITIGIAPIVGGVWLILQARKKAARFAYEQHERSILQLAQAHTAKLTATEVGIAMNITVEEANEILQSMTIKGLAQLEISDSGIPVYHFHTLISSGEKRDAEDV